MTKEDKELLIKELCMRLPYGVICRLSEPPYGEIVEPLKTGGLRNLIEEKWNVEPYLRPMSSMTEEEILDLYKIVYDTWYCDSLYYKNEEWISFRDSIQNNTLCFKSSVWLSDINKVINWLNKNMFDYRGLIPKGLAIEVNKENNPYK